MPSKKSTKTKKSIKPVDSTLIRWEEFMLSLEEHYQCQDDYLQDVKKR